MPEWNACARAAISCLNKKKIIKRKSIIGAIWFPSSPRETRNGSLVRAGFYFFVQKQARGTLHRWIVTWHSNCFEWQTFCRRMFDLRKVFETGDGCQERVGSKMSSPPVKFSVQMQNVNVRTAEKERSCPPDSRLDGFFGCYDSLFPSICLSYQTSWKAGERTLSVIDLRTVKRLIVAYWSVVWRLLKETHGSSRQIIDHGLWIVFEWHVRFLAWSLQKH